MWTAPSQLRAALRLVGRGEMAEGVAARLVERRAPAWSPPHLAQVSEAAWAPSAEGGNRATILF